MKRIFPLTLLLLVLSLGALAQDAGIAQLRLRLSNGGIIAVNLDGRYIFRNTTSLTLDGIRQGLHRVEVYEDFGPRYRPRRIYTGTIRLRPSSYNEGLVNVRQHTLQLRTENSVETSRRPDYYDVRPERPETPEEGSAPDDIYADRTPGENREGYGSFPHGRPGGSLRYDNRDFSDRDMDDLRSRVEDRITDSDKEKLMQAAIGDRRVTTAQVRQMVGWLTFESTKLEFAKWAYSRVSDKRDYWKLEDVFTFESSKEEFSKAIGKP